MQGMEVSVSPNKKREMTGILVNQKFESTYEKCSFFGNNNEILSKIWYNISTEKPKKASDFNE